MQSVALFQLVMNQTGGSESRLSSHSCFTGAECRSCSDSHHRNSHFFSQLEKLLQLLSVLLHSLSLSTCNKPTEGKRRDVNELHIKHKTTSSYLSWVDFWTIKVSLWQPTPTAEANLEQGTKCTMHCCDTSTYSDACVSVLLVHMRLFQACECEKIKSDTFHDDHV